MANEDEIGSYRNSGHWAEKPMAFAIRPTKVFLNLIVCYSGINTFYKNIGILTRKTCRYTGYMYVVKYVGGKMCYILLDSLEHLH